MVTPRAAPYRPGMTQSPARAAVCVAVDPFLFRSALYQCLLRDPRFEALLCPQGEDPSAFAEATHAPVVIASTRLDVPDAEVITVAPAEGHDGQGAPGIDLGALLDLLELTIGCSAPLAGTADRPDADVAASRPRHVPS